MVNLYTKLSVTVALGFSVLAAVGQLPCNGTITGASNLVPNAGWTASGLPGNTTVSLSLTTTAGSNLATIGACNAALITNLAPIAGPNVPGGTFISGGACGANTVQLSQNATVTGTAVHVFTMPAYASNFPPSSAGIPTSLNCSVCPGLFTTPICANQYAQYYMCPGNVYTISLCGSVAAWNSTLSITTGTFASAAGQGFVLSDDDGCGTPGGHATGTFIPSTAGVFRIRVFSNNPTMTGSTTNLSTTMTVTSTTGMAAGAGVSGPGIPVGATIASITNATTLVLSTPATSTNIAQPYSFPCTLNAGLCGTLQITCSPAPPPPLNNDPCGAIPLTVAATCNMLGTSTSWSTSSNPPAAPACGAFAGNDVWYTAVVPASGALALQTSHFGASNLAMAVYTATACNASAAGWTAQYCNADISAGVLQPYIAFNNPALAGQTVYVRVWPQSSASFGGTFEICAYEPTPPPNDNPCTAAAVPVTPGCSTVSATNQDATPTAGVPAPSCGVTATYNDVWFTVQIPLAPAGVGVIINTFSSVLNDAAMAVYTAPVCGGPYVEVGCNDPAAANAMPSVLVNQNGGTIVAGTTLYVRVWNKTSLFGNFTICATPSVPPANNEPCGATAVPLQYGCLYTSFTNTNASTTPTTLGGQHLNAPAPSCGGPANNDVWFTIQAPNPIASGQNLVIDTDDGSMSNAAMAIYRVASGDCSGTLTLTQLACQQGGSANNAAMPVITLLQNTLVPGETLYIRVWRESGADGTFSLCARRTDTPPGNCSFTLRMNDSAADGWNGGFVTICVDPSGAPPPVCTNYTIIGANGFITFPANLSDLITVAYTPVGGFQNQISYLLTTPNGGILYNSGTTPASGLVYGITVNNLCNVPPAPQEDCVGALQVCSSAAIASNPANTGAVADLGVPNRGCLVTNEHMGVWFTFQVSVPGQLGLTVNPFTYGISDYDYGLWGPYPSVTCPPSTLPLRCSWADGPSLTGLNWVATDFSENAFGDSWTQYITTNVGEWYILFVDNWYYTGLGFDLTFQGAPNCGGLNPPCASVSCVLPVRFLDFTGEVNGTHVDLLWRTASESNSSHFIVERSADGSTFSPIGELGAAGWSNTEIEYRSLDRTPLTGLNYYRLQQVDRDGKTTYSNTVVVRYRSARMPIHVYPTPTEDVVNVRIEEPPAGDLRWRVIDASGRAIVSGLLLHDGTTTTRTIPVQALEAGSYFLEMQDEQGTVIGNARFVKQ